VGDSGEGVKGEVGGINSLARREAPSERFRKKGKSGELGVEILFGGQKAGTVISSCAGGGEEGA